MKINGGQANAPPSKQMHGICRYGIGLNSSIECISIEAFQRDF
jgi:hypothetical protein